MGIMDQAATAAGAAPQAQPQPQPAAAPPAEQPTEQPVKAAGTGTNIPEEPATPKEQQEYDRVMQAVSSVLYANDKTSKAIVDQVVPDEKVGSTAKASMLFIKQLDEKVDMDEMVVASITQEVVSRIMELAEARHGIKYSQQEAEQVLGATWEGVATMFGADEAQMNELVGKVGADNLPALKEKYEAALNG